MNLSSIPGIGKASLELLEAAGFADAEALARAGVEELLLELDRANVILKIVKRLPAKGNLKKWIDAARELTGTTSGGAEGVSMPVNYELSPQVATMLNNAPFAIPLPGRILMEQRLAVADIPAAIMLNRYSGDLEVRVEDRVSAPKVSRPAMQSTKIRPQEANGSRVEMDNSRIKTIGAAVNEPDGVNRPVSTDQDVQTAGVRGPQSERNLGINPESRLHIHGVLHAHPKSLIFGAFVTLVMSVLLPVSMISAGLLLLSSEMPEKFGWVPPWLLAFPLSLPVFGFAYLIWGVSGKCRVCTQKLLVPRICMKSPSAHHIFGMGYVIPLALHILLFRWFRCTYCGTAVRLKK